MSKILGLIFRIWVEQEGKAVVMHDSMHGMETKNQCSESSARDFLESQGNSLRGIHSQAEWIRGHEYTRIWAGWT